MFFLRQLGSVAYQAVFQAALQLALVANETFLAADPGFQLSGGQSVKSPIAEVAVHLLFFLELEDGFLDFAEVPVGRDKEVGQSSVGLIFVVA